MAVSGNSLKPILVAIVANSIIALAKTIGYFFSGSSALLSEAIHSVADVMNQSLLLLGVKKGQKLEDSNFHYGYSQERFFWNLVSAMGIFVLGCGVTVYHGVHDLLEPGKQPEGGTTQLIIEIILVVSMLVEGYSFKVAISEISSMAKARGKKFFEYLKESLDPSVSAVFWEDLAAILGIAFALLGIVLTSITGNKTFDSIASISIGLLMGWIAYHLAIENKKFLIDRAVPDYEMKIILNVLDNYSLVKKHSEVKTLVFGPDRLKLSANIQLDTDALIQKVKEKLNIQSLSTQDVNHVLTEYTTTYNAVVQEELQKIEIQLNTVLPNLKHIEIRTV
jgi:solute carrier family 30 (zinc transporter), member 9